MIHPVLTGRFFEVRGGLFLSAAERRGELQDVALRVAQPETDGGEREGFANLLRENAAGKPLGHLLGRRGASSGLEPGTCTWADRGFRGNEPACLTQPSVDDVRFILNSVSKTISRLTSSDAPYLSRFFSGSEFQVRAYNDGRCMRVTRPGP